ncbi:MAG: hypothetical protein JWL69_4973 [Phycisphaerales bacterium]|nr:hypothetical protein [Phycisphaerales bacterium]
MGFDSFIKSDTMPGMTPGLQQLVREVVEVTGAQGPDLLEHDAPVLAGDALAEGEEEGFYVVGLIGGKDVGKSALVNALVGKTITAVTSTGAGTESVIAYAHVSQEDALRALLDREVPGQYRIVAHDVPNLRRQVLLDLPDIDSHYGSHLQVTRTMLRHMLYPVWVGSVEKYADQQPQQILARVAEGNTPGNFVFCLNKVDQLKGSGFGVQGSGGEGAGVQGSGFRKEGAEKTTVVGAGKKVVATPWGADVEEDDSSSSSSLNPEPGTLNPLAELREDYARRVARTLRLAEPPRVYMISARFPDRYEMPALRDLLSRQRTPQAVRESKQLALARQDRTLVTWLDKQDLAKRALRLAQLQQDAEDMVADRVGGPVLDRIVPRLLDDPATRLVMADDILQERVARWPVVNLVHTLLQPLFVLLRSAVSRAAMPMQSADGMVDAVVKDSGESIARLVQSAFAQLRQTQPAVAALYPHNKLWEDMPADIAAGNLQRALAGAIEKQRTAARDRLAGGSGFLLAPFRWLLTIGALLWFPFVQPVLSAFLASHDSHTLRNITGLVIGVLGVDYFLKSAGFLVIYYAAIWLALRWNTQRKVGRLLSKWHATDFPDPAVNLATQTVQWLEELTAPIRLARERMQSLADRADAFNRQEFSEPGRVGPAPKSPDKLERGLNCRVTPPRLL